ncbi:MULTISPECIES: hypothetical protein [unclassified Sphingomonas]|uniref:hypothetical protein n=1 Tax=unclassified Sphingomonas TaxID=196159 RepID=UPI00082AABE9|nr:MULTISPECIES: hypothetical protein [unclassified Sphingomonas]
MRAHLHIKAIAIVLSTLGGVALSSSAPATAAYRYCMSPRAPSFYGTRPTKPFCAMRRNCSSYEVESYRQDLKRYFDNLQNYLSDVDRYRKQAYEFAQCEIDAD